MSEADWNQILQQYPNYKFDPCNPNDALYTVLKRPYVDGNQLNMYLQNRIQDSISQSSKYPYGQDSDVMKRLNDYLSHLKKLKSESTNDCKLLMDTQTSVIDVLFSRKQDYMSYKLLPPYINLSQVIPFVDKSYFVAVGPANDRVARMISYKLSSLAKNHPDMQ